MRRPPRLSRLGLIFALAALLGLGIPLAIYFVGVGNRMGWSENVPGENSAIIIFGAVLPILGACLIAYAVGERIDRGRR